MTGSKADIVEVMARALIDARGHARSLAEARAALTALEAAGYTVIKKTPGIYHPQEPFEGEK